MRYEFEGVVIDLPDEYQFIDISTLNDAKKVLTICPSRDEQDRIARETMEELKAGAGQKSRVE